MNKINNLTLETNKTALVIQDLQNDNISQDGAKDGTGSVAHAKSQNVVENVKNLAQAARTAGIPVIHIWYIVEKNAVGLKTNAPLFQDVKESSICVRGTWGAEPAKGLEPLDSDFIVEKMRMNGFHDSRLDILLRGLEVETLILTGAFTNFLIEHTARHGADAGYKVIVASDGTSTLNDEWQYAALNYALTQITQVANCDEIDKAIRK